MQHDNFHGIIQRNIRLLSCREIEQNLSHLEQEVIMSIGNNIFVLNLRV